ncbi:DUF6377 domain-containing protein [Mucilaginibacter flavus]|uniref:DUF6377 domain-containing protein n=1 Tax=Mucilaginibacter flavus TaxID=931504 RepID=UPI0025B3BB34|nr:DUF6377 domain-containing protein [Mucilaginibacter flavus]MDN3583010.1 DUF6377 domain-containing protein [Mucilaginibacter flavus]
MKRFLTCVFAVLSGIPVFAITPKTVNYASLIFNRTMAMSLIFAIVVMMVLIAVIIRGLLKRLKQKDLIIEDKINQLEGLNEKLTTNALINEEYIGYFVSMISTYISKLERLKRVTERKVATKKYEDILLPFNEIDIKEERRALYQNFDDTFLKIFPNFITEFNAMLKPEDKIWPKKNEGLNTELRIFALMRLGITDCETIAGILEYSSNTIYVYKMRIKAKSIIEGDAFDQTIKSIKATTFEEPPLLYIKSA